MAFQQPTIYRRTQQITRSLPQSTSQPQTPLVEESQEWILFAPSQTQSSSHATSQGVELSRASDLGSLPIGHPASSVLDDVTEDDLDSLDDGLHAFREPIYNNSNGPVLPTHDGLGQFPASAVLEQLWQHEQHNPKRKHEGHHRRASSVHRKFVDLNDFEAQANEDKRVRIEKWRMEQSQAFLEEVEKETRRQMRNVRKQTMENVLGSTPKQSDFIQEENVPFWKRITRKFIRDVIGIDEPLLSVILGESLLEDAGDSTPRPSSPLEPILEQEETPIWRTRLLERIAKELEVFVHQLTPHPGAFTTYEDSTPDYAGIPIRSNSTQSIPILSSTLTPNFSPTIQKHTENWGFEDESNSLKLDEERKYWEKELDIKMIFEFLKNRFVTKNEDLEPFKSNNDATATRTAIIRQHHPLIGKTHRSPVRRRDSRMTRRPGSSCASESVKSGRKASRSSSRNYWDIGGSIGSGSLLASGGGWGEI